MKNIKIIFSFVIVAMTIISCQPETIGPRVDANAPSGLVSFNNNVDLAVPIDTTGEQLDIPINVSNLSSADRTVNVVLDTDASNADPSNYSVPATITIPANSYVATLTVTGNDVSLETAPQSILLNFEPSSEGLFIDNSMTINIFQVCPIPDTYMIGDYAIGDQAAVFGGANFDPGTVTIAQGSASTIRSFDTTFFGNPITVNLNLVCNELIFSNTFDTGFVSAGAPIILRPATNNDSTYDLSDDSIFIVEYDNEAGGNGTFEGSFFLIKL